MTNLEIFDQIKGEFKLSKEYYLEFMSLEEYEKCLDITYWIHIDHTNVCYINLNNFDIRAEYHISENKIMDIQYTKMKKDGTLEEVI